MAVVYHDIQVTMILAHTKIIVYTFWLKMLDKNHIWNCPDSYQRLIACLHKFRLGGFLCHWNCSLHSGTEWPGLGSAYSCLVTSTHHAFKLAWHQKSLQPGVGKLTSKNYLCISSGQITCQCSSSWQIICC
jgi:hypothetical protein